MNNEYALGEEIEFMLPDKDGTEHWFPGTIHGVRDYAETETTYAKRTYLVDTGRDERLDEYTRDKLSDVVNERSAEIVADEDNPIDNFHDAINEVLTHDDLPESELYVEKVRQPEQLELIAESLRRPEKSRAT
jgi:hypothetical protein